MRDLGFFGHRSPQSGDLSQRLRRAGEKSAASAENLALNENLFDAQAGLMRSLGHRQNLLSSEFTDVGVGIFGAQSGKRRWWITQIFSLPAPVIDPKHGRAEILTQLHAARRRAGLPALKFSPDLQKIATQEAGSASPSPKAALKRFEALKWSVWAGASFQQISLLSQFEIPKAVLEPQARRLGVGLIQDRSLEGSDINIFLLLSG